MKMVERMIKLPSGLRVHRWNTPNFVVFPTGSVALSDVSDKDFRALVKEWTVEIYEKRAFCFKAEAAAAIKEAEAG